MAQVIYYVAASVDGFIAPDDGSTDWLLPFQSRSEDYGYESFFRSVDALLEGSRTFEQASTFARWPHPGKPCRVFTNRPLRCSIPEVGFTSETPASEVSRLESQGHRRLWLVGGSSLAGSFLLAGLVSEVVVTFVPVILGSGKLLFSGVNSRRALALNQVRSFSDGVLQVSYAGA